MLTAVMNNSNNNTIIFNDKSRSLLEFSANDGTFTIWLYAFTSVIIISICGLVPIICMPRLQRTRYQNDLLQFLIGLAIGTLTADALLHLLPISSHKQAHGILPNQNSSKDINDHSSHISGATSTALLNNKANDYHDDDHDHHGHTHPTDEGFWFGFMALVGILGFLLLERIMVLLTDVCTHKEHSVASTKTDSDSERKSVSVPMTDPHLHNHQNHHQHQHHHLTSKTKSFMFMIITGDGLHNFFDGIAIGVSYGSSLAVGLSTSIAILCHELPHEIGDFAVLIKSGMSIKRAVLYNTLSSILCLLGATTGVFIGKIDVGWVSALIAGMFLYISLVDMVPQLDCYPAQPALKRARKLLIQILGIASGVGIMSLIATYESKLHSLITTTYNH